MMDSPPADDASIVTRRAQECVYSSDASGALADNARHAAPRGHPTLAVHLHETVPHNAPPADAPRQICIIRVEDIAPGSPYVADTMPTLAKAPRYRSACGLARDDSPPSAAYPPVAHPPPPPALQNLPPPHNTHSTPRPRSVEHTANL